MFSSLFHDFPLLYASWFYLSTVTHENISIISVAADQGGILKTDMLHGDIGS